MIKQRYLLVILIFTFSCKKEALTESEQFINTFEEYVSSDSHSPDYIYDQNNLHRFDIYLSEENLNILDENPAAENYVEGSLVFEGKALRKVGVRYKGSIGAWVGCLSGEDVFNPSGYKTCPKLSLKIKINWNGNDTFYGLKKLQFHSQNLDQSMMHERLGYWMFRNFNVPAPRSNHALIYINGEFNGVYANTEHIDGPFANNHFENGEGNIYKEVWPINSEGNPHSQTEYINALKTNEEASNVSKIIKFANEVTAADDSNINQVVDKWIDKEQFLRTIVVDRRIAHDDGFLHWYAVGDIYASNHNYFWYEDSLNDKIQLIPWDLDNAFDNIYYIRNPLINIIDNWNEVSNDCDLFYYGVGLIKQKSAACDKIIGSYTKYTDTYEELDSIFKANYFNLNNDNIELIIDDSK